MHSLSRTLFSYDGFEITPTSEAVSPKLYFLFTCTDLNFVSTLYHPPHMRQFHLTLRRLMSYIYGAPVLDVSRSHTTTQYSR